MAFNVLLIDDSRIVRKVLMKTFSMTDISVNAFFEAENGKEGLELLKSNPVDVIFLDINMPIMSGIEFLESIRKEEAFKRTPVIIVSTEGSKDRRESLIELGVDAYLRKPVSPESLVKTIEQVLGQNRGGN